MASLPYPRRPLDNSPTDGTDAHRLGGYGIPAIPTPPSANPPTEFTEFTEVSGARYSPTDFTEAHRLGGYGIPAIPTPPSANPPTEFTEISGVEEPPTDFTDAHRWLGCVRFCGKIVWCLRGYGRMPYPPIIAQTGETKILRVLCNPWENISARNICAHLCHLWEDISARGFCWFCEFCGRMQWLLGWCT